MARMRLVQRLRPPLGHQFQQPDDPRPQSIGQRRDLAIHTRVKRFHPPLHIRYIPYTLYRSSPPTFPPSG